MQSFKEELPSYVENLDAGQFLQIVAPTCFWFSLYLPFAHAMHFVWSSINVYFLLNYYLQYLACKVYKLSFLFYFDNIQVDNLNIEMANYHYNV